MVATSFGSEKTILLRHRVNNKTKVKMKLTCVNQCNIRVPDQRAWQFQSRLPLTFAGIVLVQLCALRMSTS
jgi:hypothetical protein